MSRADQTTLRRAVHCVGTGLHSGKPVSLRLEPAPAGVGIVFVRADLGGVRVPATYDRVVDTRLGTTIANDDGAEVATIEHLMAALAGAAVDNALVMLDAPEVPIMDGSAAPFSFLLREAGLRTLRRPRRSLKVLRPITVEDGGRRAALLPGEGFHVDCEIAFESHAIGRQRLTFTHTAGAFDREIASARTFGFAHEIEGLRSAGLALGGSLDNAIVVEGDKVLNPEGLRHRDEFVRHKLLDAIGDLYLAGGPIIGRFQSVRGGHEMNNRLLRALFAREDAYAWVIERAKPSAAASVSAPAPLPLKPDVAIA